MKENTMKFPRMCFAALVVLSLLTGCNLGTSPISLQSPTPVVTSTITKEPSITPIPLPTRRATFELFPTITRGPSVTPMPLFTPIPANVLLTIQAQVTEARSGGAATQPYQCKVLSSYPEPGAILAPKEEFKAIWRIVNTGRSSWTTNNVAFFYRWGTKFQPKTYREDFIPYVVNVKDQINLQVPMHAPKEPGLYSAVWGLRSKSTKTFFCNLSIIIQVVPRDQ
jgi:hypothetical protein